MICNYTDAYFSLGATMEWTKKYDDALDAYNKYIELAPEEDSVTIQALKEYLPNIDKKKAKYEGKLEPPPPPALKEAKPPDAE